MRNKQKRWRTEARTHNEMNGRKHQGRAYKTTELPEFARAGISNTPAGLMLNAGILA